MKLSYTFKHMQVSEALVEYTVEKMNRLGRYELKPYHVHLSYSIQRFIRQCDIHIKGPSINMKSTAKEDDIYQAVDLAVDKLERQLERNKGRVQHHKLKHLTDEAQLDRMNESLEIDFTRVPKFRKAG